MITKPRTLAIRSDYKPQGVGSLSGECITYSISDYPAEQQAYWYSLGPERRLDQNGRVQGKPVIAQPSRMKGRKRA
jgi:hypothetical protein